MKGYKTTQTNKQELILVKVIREIIDAEKLTIWKANKKTQLQQ